MPSFTFAATAHAAIWAGLVRLLCDIDAETWNSCRDAEAYLLSRYEDSIACIVPHACFGNSLSLERYEKIAHDKGVGLV
jgi:dTDP-4-amino-4,6-dideoxygalactose transaminase